MQLTSWEDKTANQWRSSQGGRKQNTILCIVLKFSFLSLVSHSQIDCKPNKNYFYYYGHRIQSAPKQTQLLIRSDDEVLRYPIGQSVWSPPHLLPNWSNTSFTSSYPSCCCCCCFNWTVVIGGLPRSSNCSTLIMSIKLDIFISATTFRVSICAILNHRHLSPRSLWFAAINLKPKAHSSSSPWVNNQSITHRLNIY